MLQFIFGRPSTGKTYTVLNKIKDLANEGKHSILIVPEQFTFESEKAVLDTLGDRSALFAQVLSFTRLFDEIGRSIGGIAGTALSESDKIVFMNKTLRSVGDDLLLWSRYKSSVEFAKNILDAVGEFKINAITPEELRSSAQEVDTPTLRNKLLDLALIYENYDALIGEKFLDPADTLTVVYEQLKNFEFFKDKTVFLDSFKGFTGQQYKIIERIFSQAEDVYVSLTNDPEIKGDYTVFANIRKAVLNIEALAKSRAVSVIAPIALTENHGKEQQLIATERLMAGGSFCEDNDTEESSALCICKAQTLFDEAEFAATEIRRLVRTEGYRYRDFVIIARDGEKYQTAVENACRKNNVNCFCDTKIPLSAFPLSVAAKSAIEAVSLLTQGILNFQKTGLGVLNHNEIALLENYTFVWGISGNLWEREWDMDPRGITTDSPTEETQNRLKEINALRVKCITPLLKFKTAFCGSAKDMATALINLFDDCNSIEALKEMSFKYKSVNNSFYSDALKLGLEEFMKILDSLVACFGDVSITKKEFSDALNLAVSLSSVGVIPQTLDEVIFGSADRIRPSRPKIAFILGANQGEFPKNISKQGIFASNERRKLTQMGMNISDNGIEASVNENYLVYCNLSCASERLYISYSEKTILGEALELSTFVGEIRGNLKCRQISFGGTLKTLSPETPACALGEYYRMVRPDPKRALELKTALEDTRFFGNINSVKSGEVKKNDTLTGDTARLLYGENINMSATRLDTFNRCRFSYFCRYGLKAEKLKSADFNVLQRGTIVHYCLERIISEYKKGIADLDYAVIDRLCDGYIEEYLNSVGGFESIKNAKTEFIIDRISHAVKEVAHSISDEMKQCDFEPYACELKIGGKECDIPAVKFPFDGGNIFLNGSIDRVDTYNGYVRIIDYKTGSKSFKLPDIVFGLNLQMLVYLYALVRANGIENAKTGGIFYKPSKRDTNEKGLAMNGLIPNDEQLLTAMEHEGKGEFVPKYSVASRSFISYEDFDEVFDHIERIMKRTGNAISKGDISVSPLDGREAPACKYCEFSSVCGIEDSKIERVALMSNKQVIEALREDKNAD